MRVPLRSLTFDKQLRIFITAVMLCTFGLFLVISTVSTVVAITRQNAETASGKIGTLADSITDKFDYYHTLSVSLIIDEYVQAFCRDDAASDEVAFKVFNSLSNYLNIDGNINFLAVRRASDGKMVYKGQTSLADAWFDQGFAADAGQASLARYKGSIRISFAKNFFRGDRYTLTLYVPIYPTTFISDEIGLLVVNFDDDILEIQGSGSGDADSSLYICDMGGRVFAASQKDLIGTSLPLFSGLSGNTGSFMDSGRLVSWHFIEKWNYCVINATPLWSLYSSSVKTALILLGLIAIIVAGAVVVSGRMVKKLYAPLDGICSVMERVSEGELDIALDAENMGEDLKKVAWGFNSMMRQIVRLMEQVKTEQHQLEQIRINALQAQIQPHFLYNTLECIHWQTVGEGNKDASTLVKALAKYYRICLSKGKDIIKLETELEHVRSYVIIHNMRHDENVELEIGITDRHMSVMIPKITLQPLIENAIVHGMKAGQGERGVLRVRIDAQEGDGALTLCVCDSGKGMDADAIREMNESLSEYLETPGFGVRNVHRRIELLFGKGYGLRFEGGPGGGVAVYIRIPLELNVAYESVL
ncbi:MAG: sensor histidine kinase [Lachnospiraceae bacterium]|nr:sensor histidine kinase [Lachnospiraceae bacterium]